MHEASILCDKFVNCLFLFSGFAVHDVIQDEKREREYYEKYLRGGDLPELMREETERRIKSCLKGDSLRKHISEYCTWLM